jgi:two-component system alkaline phosphatase synthesis response regulator PhoP
MEQDNNKILIIEDEKALARALELKLTHEGFLVTSLSSGELALPLLEKEVFCMIVCDLVMPKVDGFKVLEFIKEKNIKTPVIVLTNLSQTEDEKRVRDLGATNFFVKSNTPLSQMVIYIKDYIFHSK